MTNERLKELQDKAQRATKLADDISAIEAIKSVNDFKGLGWDLQVELFEAGRKALLFRKQEALESIIGAPEVMSLDMGVQLVQ